MSTTGNAKRKIIQIISMAGSDRNLPTVHALCDDGTTWTLNLAEGWTPHPLIPQPEPQGKKK